MKYNSFRKGKIQGKVAKKLQEGQVIWPNVFQTNGRSGLLEKRLANLQKGRHEWESEKGKGVSSRTNIKANDE